MVADEVRTLAAKVNDATRQISGFLNDMEVILLSVLDELIGEVEAVAAEKVKSA